jgi:hypothetical protein
MLKVKTPVAVVSLLAISALALGACGSDSDPDVPSASSLVGTWTGSPVGYGGEGQPKLEAGYPVTFVIKEGDDSSRSFAGERIVAASDAKKYNTEGNRENIVGEIAPWGEISMVNESGTWTLEMDGDDKMEGRYLEGGSDLAAKSITLTRQK